MPRMRLLAGLVFGCALTAGVLIGAATAPLEGVSSEAVQRLRLRNLSLTRELELAAGKSFYLLLDPAASQLTLNYRGTELHRWTVVEASLGTPRIAFVRQEEPRDWTAVVWSDGKLNPQRPADRAEINVAAGADQNDPEPPPPPEVAIPVPASYLLQYEPGLVLEVARSGASAGGWRARGREVLAALSPAQRRTVRIRIVMSSADADSLYRSLPPDSALMIVAPASGEDARAAGRVQAASVGTPPPARAQP
jgi:hypothetical protein